jgi:hypothetical protein
MDMSRSGYLMLVLLCLPFAAQADDGWRLSLQRDSVRVWTRAEPGSAIQAFRAETTVRSSVSALLTLFYDLDAAPRWLDHTRRVEAITRDDVNHKYVLRLETALPWPLRDRDAVIVGRWWQDPASGTVYMRGQSAPPGAYPENPDYLRYNDMRSDWTFAPAGDGMVRVIMEGHADPAGSVPAWAVNMLIQESPFKTLSNLRTIIAEQRYQNSHIKGLDMASPLPAEAVVATP